MINTYKAFNLGRTDFYWEYSDGVPYCVKKQFMDEDLSNHLIGKKVDGFTPFIDNVNVIFAGVDCDAHRDTKDTNEEYSQKVTEAQGDAVKIYNYLKSYKLAVILNSSGSDGRHVRWAVNKASAKSVRMYLKYVLFKLFGDPNKHEVFPKQDNLSEDRPYGNQMKGMLCIHPKHKKRANVIIDGKMLNISDSFIEMERVLSFVNNVPNFTNEDYAEVEALDKSHNYIEKYNSKEYLDTQSVPEYCSFFEDVAAQLPLPSKDKYSRHFCLDSNMAAYGITHPDTRIAYAETQGRSSHTAFDNWTNYWTDDKPVFSCGQIISYLRNHSRYGNTNASLGLKKCLNCPKFKSFIEQQEEEKFGPVRGWAKNISIINFAKEHNLERCPECDGVFKFKDKYGWYYCKKCDYGGGLKKFALMVIKQAEVKKK